MNNKEVKKCCVCGHYDKPKIRVYDGFVCSDSCFKQHEHAKDDLISSHKCEVCGKDIRKCRIEDVYVSTDYNSFDDRDIVFLCSTSCYAYYNKMLLKETPAYSKIDKIVQKRKADGMADIQPSASTNDMVKDLCINSKKLSEEEAKEISEEIIDRIKDMCDIDIDNNGEQPA